MTDKINWKFLLVILVMVIGMLLNFVNVSGSKKVKQKHATNRCAWFPKPFISLNSDVRFLNFKATLFYDIPSFSPLVL